ncbi:hypothetical protein PGTUg99_029642 [Puccinia graminis f. sp. tritici]|uniref:Uncharacterized protein n=1 Tax=Puccinia graminis f. sp. tritici TaxID=56615 RepID=A0A5B0NK05_PUCGR|nr:hypothetical protein PGTUg99_029642 [Puccinia graminis f. sp. tritici]
MSLLAANTQPASSSTLSAAIQRNSSLPIQTNNTHRGLEETATADRFSGETPTACPAVVVVLARGVGGLFRLSRLSSWSDWESPLRFQWALPLNKDQTSIKSRGTQTWNVDLRGSKDASNEVMTRTRAIHLQWSPMKESQPPQVLTL